VAVATVLWTVRYPEHAGDVIIPAADVPLLAWIAAGRALHSSTLQLNLSAFCVTGGAGRGCFGDVQGVVGGV